MVTFVLSFYIYGLNLFLVLVMEVFCLYLYSIIISISFVTVGN